MSHGAGGEIRRSFYDPASREPSLGGQMAVCGRGHLEAASAGKQLRLRPASGSWRRPRGRPWPGGPSSPGPGSVLSAASAGECQLVLGAWGGRSLPPRGGAGGWPQGIWGTAAMSSCYEGVPAAESSGWPSPGECGAFARGGLAPRGFPPAFPLESQLLITLDRVGYRPKFYFKSRGIYQPM